MAELNQDFTARRFQSFDTRGVTPPPPPRCDAGYECEPPPEVQAELVRPRRPRILGRKRSPGLNPAAKMAVIPGGACCRRGSRRRAIRYVASGSICRTR